MKKTIGSLIQSASKTIYRLDAELLLAHALKTEREFLIAHNADPVSLLERLTFALFVKKRKKGIPVAHITKHKHFFGLDFFVNKHTLVPRPDTELLVEVALAHILTRADVVVADVGTGSGCIPIAIKHVAKNKVHIYASDISKKALAVAKKNAKRLNTHITFRQGDLLEPLLPNLVWHQNPIVITANLPYLTEEQFQREPSIQHEPIEALVAHDNGLHLYDILLEQILLLQTVTTSVSAVYFECDPDQAEELSIMVMHRFPEATIHIYDDLSGHERVVAFHP